jgi:hypothetical protein
MNIKKIDDFHWEIKTKNTKVIFNDGVKIGDFVVPGEGEYEVGGIELENFDGVYSFDIDGMQIVFIKKDKKNFSEKEMKKIGDIDLLFLPVDGEGTMDTKSALKLISSIEPEIIIPTYYDNLLEFTKSEGVNAEEIADLKISKNDLEDKQRKVYILK